MMKNNEIEIFMATDDAINTLSDKNNMEYISNKIKENPDSNKWLYEEWDDLFVKMKYTIPDFKLDTSNDGDYSKVEYNNSIKLYEALKDLPRYILTDEKFWVWINLEKCYEAAVQAMPIKSASTFGDHYLFRKGRRRGNFFGVMSRCFFRVYLTVDEELEDKYYYTRFVIEKPERIRNLTWRANSSQKHIVQTVIKAEKFVYDEYMNDENKRQMFIEAEKSKDRENIYTDVAKYLSLYGSVRLLDVVSTGDLFAAIVTRMREYINKRNASVVEIL